MAVLSENFHAVTCKGNGHVCVNDAPGPASHPWGPMGAAVSTFLYNLDGEFVVEVFNLAWNHQGA